MGEYQNQEIAEMVGYSDQFYFSKRFKQACGVSPTEYQRGNRKK
jgi:AraC-like DNA-binding protein